METKAIAICGRCADTRHVDHAPDFCRGCRSHGSRWPRAILRMNVVVEGTTIRVRPIAEFHGEWAARDRDAIERAIAEGVEARRDVHRWK